MAGKLNKELQDIQKLVGLLGKDIDRLTFERLKEDTKFAAEYAKDLRDELNASIGETDSLSAGFRNIQEELTNGSQSLRDMNSSMGSLKSISEKLENIKSGIAKADEKSLSKLQEQFESEEKKIGSLRSGLELSRKKLTDKLKEVDLNKSEVSQLAKINAALGEATSIITRNNGLFEETRNTLKEIDDLNEEIDHKLGALPGVASGLDTILGKIGIKGIGFGKALEDAKKQAQESGDATKVWSNYTSNLGKQFKKLLSPSNLILGAITGLIAAIVSVDKETGELAKSMGRSYLEALNTRKELTLIAKTSGDAALNTKRLQETLTYVNNELGTSGTLTEGNLKTFTKLREQAGMSNESIQSMNKYSMVMGGDLEKNTVNFQAQAKALSLSKGVSLNVKQLMGDMAKVSNRTKLSIQGGADGLATAAVNAKLMGSNMADVEKIADSLLDFESSIEKELSAELLTGKNLNLEKARTAALNNDMATVAAEITKQAGSAAEFGNMNRIQQEAIAAAMGMSAESMADMLYEQEAIKSIGIDLTDEQQKAFELAKDKYGVEEASRILKSKAQGEGIEGLIKEQSMQEEFNDSIAQMKEIFIDISQNVIPAIKMALEPIMFVMSGISEVVGYVMDGFKAVYDMITSSTPALIAFGVGLGTILAIQTVIAYKNKESLVYRTASAIIEKGQLAVFAIQLAMEKRKTAGKKKNVVLSIAGAAMEAFKSLALTPFIGPILGGIAAAAAVAYGYSLLKGDDVMSAGGNSPGYGNRTLFGPEGAIQLNNKDTVIAGTDLGGKKKSKPQGGGGGGASVDLTQTNALLQQLINTNLQVIKVIQTGGIITLDGQKVGEALKLGSFQTQ